MAINENVAKVLENQINKELYSAYLYLTFADYYEDRGLKGFANWYMVQVQERRTTSRLSVATCSTMTTSPRWSHRQARHGLRQRS